MASPPPDVTNQAARNAAITALAARELAQLWPQVDWESPRSIDAVKTVYRAIVTRYGRASASVAAEFYDNLRSQRDERQPYRAVVAEPFPAPALDRAVEKAFAGRVNVIVLDSDVLDDDEHTHSDETTSDLPLGDRVQVRLDGKLQRHVQQAGRNTIAQNAEADDAATGWIRVPRGEKTCAFCIMLASRAIDIGFSGYGKSSVKYSEDDGRNIHVVTGAGRTPTASRNGLRDVGEKYHDWCDCEPMPLFAGQTEWEISPNFGDYQDKYYKASANAGTSTDTRKILASMRQLYDVK